MEVVGRRLCRTFSTEIFRRRFDGVVIYFFNPDFKFFDDDSEFSVTSLYVVFIFSSKFMLIFLLYNRSSDAAETGDRLTTIDTGRREGGCCAPFRGASNNVAWGPEIYRRTEWHHDPSSRFATIDMAQKVGCCAPFRGLDSHSTLLRK